MSAHTRPSNVEPWSILLGFVLITFVLLVTSCAPAAPGSGSVVEPTSVPKEEAKPVEQVKATEAPKQTEVQVVGVLPMVPPPRTCDPAKPMLDAITVVSGPETGPYGPSIYTMQARYANKELNQEFLLTVSSGKPEQLVKFVENLKVCYEALDSGFAYTSERTSEASPEEDRASAIQFLTGNPNHVLFEFQLLTRLDTKPENIVVIHAVVDPTIDNDRVDDFRAKCTTWASVSVTVYTNSAYAQLYRRGTLIGSTNVAAAGTTSPTVSHNNGATRTTYDARVLGPSGTSYQLNGTWCKEGSTVSASVCP
jgi:hypothetical protein